MDAQAINFFEMMESQIDSFQPQPAKLFIVKARLEAIGEDVEYANNSIKNQEDISDKIQKFTDAAGRQVKAKLVLPFYDMALRAGKLKQDESEIDYTQYIYTIYDKYKGFVKEISLFRDSASVRLMFNTDSEHVTIMLDGNRKINSIFGSYSLKIGNSHPYIKYEYGRDGDDWFVANCSMATVYRAAGPSELGHGNGPKSFICNVRRDYNPAGDIVANMREFRLMQIAH